MQLKVVCFFDYDKKKIDLIQTYEIEDLAIQNIEKHALEYIKNQQGIQQSNIALQKNKKENDIIEDDNFKEGYYLLSFENGLKLFEKKKLVSKGYFYTNFDYKIELIGLFMISTLNLDSQQEEEIAIDESNNNLVKETKIMKLHFLEELNKRLTKSINNFGLKSSKSVDDLVKTI